MRLRNFIFGVILTFIICAIIYEVVSESVVKPIEQKQQERIQMLDDLINSLEP